MSAALVSATRLAVVLSGFPRTSETFALGELLALERHGMLAAVFATKRGDAAFAQPDTGRLATPVRYLPEGDAELQAAAVAARLKGLGVDGIHGYFAHDPADVARRAAARLGVPYGFSVHARDARKVPPDALADRARGAACVVACNADVARELDRTGARVHSVPHGVDLARFRPTRFPPEPPLRLLAVGRLVEKKGFHVLLDAASRLDVPFHLRVVGEGPERDRLAAAIAARGLGDRVELCGTRTHSELPAEYAAAHAVVAPSIEDRTGDRDGLPNVVLEAMACGRTVVASDAGAIASAVVDGETGLLTRAGDAAGLAHALARLAREPGLGADLAARASALVERDYEVTACTDRLRCLLEAAYA